MNITPDEFTALQVQLWSIVSPIVPWLVALFFAGGILLALLIYSLVFMREWSETVAL